jgi:hypothetical protein
MSAVCQRRLWAQLFDLMEAIRALIHFTNKLGYNDLRPAHPRRWNLDTKFLLCIKGELVAHVIYVTVISTVTARSEVPVKAVSSNTTCCFLDFMKLFTKHYFCVAYDKGITRSCAFHFLHHNVHRF